MTVRARRGKQAAGVLALAVTVLAGVLVARQLSGPACGAQQQDDPVSPLQNAATLDQRPDQYRDRLAAALGAMPAPFGEVRAGTDYYFERWLQLFGVPGGLLAWTKNNAPVTYLDDATLEPAWSLRPTATRTAWDVSADRFVLLDLLDDAPVTVAAFDLATGSERWCVTTTARHRPGDPVATTFTTDGDVVVALPAGSDPGSVELVRLSAAAGEPRWSATVSEVGRADFLGSLDQETLLIGGTEESRLTDPAAASDPPGSLTAVDAADAQVRWTWKDPGGGRSHVVAAGEGTALVLVKDTDRAALVSLDSSGQERWRRTLPPGAREATARSGVVVVRAEAGLSAFGAQDGVPRWQRPLPTEVPTIPLGFSLAQMPSPDAGTLLVPTVKSLELLSLADGTSRSYPMPTEGLSSAYFPYQLLATAEHLGVVTNTGAVVVARQ